MKNYNKDKEESFLQYLDDNNSYGWAMSQKLHVSGFKLKKNILKFNEEFIRTMMKIVIKDIFLKYMLNILKIYMFCMRIYHSYLKE